MKRMSLSSLLNIIINAIMFFYILSLYLLTYREGLNNISNALAFLLVTSVWINFLLSRKKLIINKLLVTFLLFIIICTISVFYAIEQSIAITKVRTLILIFLLMFSLTNYLDSFEKVRKLITYFIYSGFIASVYILSNSDYSHITRFGEVLGNVNTVGVDIGMSATFCYYFIFNEKKYWYIFLLLVMITITILTGSRSALLFIFINLILITCLYYLKANNNKFKGILKIMTILVLLLFITYYIVFKVPLFYEILGKRIENVFLFLSGESVNEGSIYMRDYMIRVGLEFFKNRPFTGYGIDNYRVLFGIIPGGLETYSHNNYIELMVGTGIFGVLVYYFIQILVLIELFNASKRDISGVIMCYVFMSIIMSHIILSLSLVYYYKKHFNLLLAISSALSAIKKVDKSHRVKTNCE